MGLTDSKFVAEVVSRACSDAEKSGKADIDPVLGDPKVLDSLHSLWSSLPGATKRKIDPGLTTRRNGRPKKVRNLKRSPDSEIALLPDLVPRISVWNEDPLSFFNEGESKLELTDSPSDGMYTYMKKSTKRTEMDTIRLRLLKVMYYRLSWCVGWTQLHHKRAKRLAQTTFNSDLLAWANEGKRIDKLCRDIGCVTKLERSDQYFHLGNLFYSLPDVADYVVKELPFKGDPRPEEIHRLKRRSGLCDTEHRKNFELLAHKVLDTIWKAYQNAGFPLEQGRRPGGYSLEQDARSFTLPVSSAQKDNSIALAYEHISLDENIRSPPTHNPVHGSSMTSEDGALNTQEGTPRTESEAANLDCSTSPVDANQTNEPNPKRRRIQRDGSVASAPFGALLSSPRDSDSAGNRRQSDASQFSSSIINPHGPLPGQSPMSLLQRQRELELVSERDLGDRQEDRCRFGTSPRSQGLEFPGCQNFNREFRGAFDHSTVESLVPETELLDHPNYAQPVVLPENTQTMLSLDLQGEQTMMRMGSTFNIHENPQSMLPLQYLGLQEGQPMTRMGRPFDVHDSPQAILPLQYLGLQEGQPMTRMGRPFNVHDNPQSMSLLQSGQAMMGMGSAFNIHDNPQSMSSLQSGQAMTGMGSAFNIHDNPQSMSSLQSGQAMTGMGSAFNIHESQRSMLPLHYLGLEDEPQTCSVPFYQQQSIPGQPLTPILVG